MRSLLLVAGDDPAGCSRALRADADALIIDLEATVSLTGKVAARGLAAAFLAEATGEAVRPLLYVRVNGLGSGLTDADLAAVLPAGADGIVLPDAVGGADVQRLAAKLAVAEAEAGIADGRTRILAVATGSARGMLAIGTLPGASPRLAGIAWECDGLLADLGAETRRDRTGRDSDAARQARLLCLLAAAAGEVDAVDAPFSGRGGPAALEAECRAARRDGFAAKIATHPDEVAIINDVFSLSADGVRDARET